MTSSNVVLLISMPTLGQISTPTTKCLIGLTQYLSREGIPFAFETYEFSDIVFSRNQLMCMFQTRKEFTHILMMDSDMMVERRTTHGSTLRSASRTVSPVVILRFARHPPQFGERQRC